MAGVGIVHAKCDSEYRAILDALARASMPKLLQLADFVGAELDVITKKAFEMEKDPVSGKEWLPLKKARPDGSTHPILRRGGQLFRSLISESYPDGSVIYGSNMVYARIHQEGGSTGRSDIPARPYLGIPRNFDRRILADSAVQRLLGLGGI